jgi:hypothetical protein
MLELRRVVFNEEMEGQICSIIDTSSVRMQFFIPGDTLNRSQTVETKPPNAVVLAKFWFLRLSNRFLVFLVFGTDCNPEVDGREKDSCSSPFRRVFVGFVAILPFLELFCPFWLHLLASFPLFEYPVLGLESVYYVVGRELHMGYCFGYHLMVLVFVVTSPTV